MGQGIDDPPDLKRAENLLRRPGGAPPRPDRAADFRFLLRDRDWQFTVLRRAPGKRWHPGRKIPSRSARARTVKTCWLRSRWVGRGRSPGGRGVPFGAAWRAGCCWAPWSAFRSPKTCLCTNCLALRSSISKPANSRPSPSRRSFLALSAILRRSRRAPPTLHDISCILQPWARLPGRRCGRPGAPRPPGKPRRRCAQGHRPPAWSAPNRLCAPRWSLPPG